MGMPDGLLAGDALLYLNNGWLGGLISWGEWTGTPGEALEYSHIALHGGAKAYEMNPPHSRSFPLSEVPWDRVHVYRAETPEGIALFRSASAVQALIKEAERRLGEPYDYGQIANALGASLLARLGLFSWSRALVQGSAAGGHGDVCSTWAQEVMETALSQFQKERFDLFPDLGARRARPSDWPRSPWMRRVI